MAVVDFLAVAAAAAELEVGNYGLVHDRRYSIHYSQEYITPSTEALFLDAPSVNISPSLEIQAGAMMEVHTTGCVN